jgi:hypothetical protein
LKRLDVAHLLHTAPAAAHEDASMRAPRVAALVAERRAAAGRAPVSKGGLGLAGAPQIRQFALEEKIGPRAEEVEPPRLA